MTLPYPRSIPVIYAFGFGFLLAVSLLAEGNPPLICFALMLICVVGTIGFNAGGGLSSPVGAYVLFVTLFTGLLGATTKLVLNEPLLENVVNADETLNIYLVGTCTMVAAVFLSKRFARKVPILRGRLTNENTARVVTGCVAFGIFMPFILNLFFPGGAGAIGTIISQLNILLPLAVVIGVYHRTVQTNGRTTFNWPSFVAFAYSTYVGLAAFSKEGIFGAGASWLVAAAAGRARLGVLKAMMIVVFAGLSVYVLVPYAQYGRNFRLGYGGNFEKSKALLQHPLATRELAYENSDQRPPELYHWYRKSQGIFDRLTLVPIDSALIGETDLTAPLGWTNAGLYFVNIVPHFLLPDKPDLNTGNTYAHEIGMLAGADRTTGISFSPFAEAYHLGGWMGVVFLLPGVLLFMFVVLQSVTGSLEDSPWGIFFIAYMAHGAAEGMLQIPVRLGSIGAEAILACAFFMIYVTPLVGELLIGPEKRVARRVASAQAVTRRAT